jgi:hypothetical protein
VGPTSCFGLINFVAATINNRPACTNATVTPPFASGGASSFAVTASTSTSAQARQRSAAQARLRSSKAVRK